MSFLQPEGISEKIFNPEETVVLPIALEFLHNEFMVLECFQEHLDLALVQRNPDKNEFATHRLVQSECRYYVKDADRQMYYDYATTILCVAFQKQQDERFGDRLPLCARHIHHVYALGDNLSGGRGYQQLQTSDDFCILMRNASWYCVEVHQTKELESTVTIAMDAAKKTGFIDREPRHYAQLCNCASRLWAQSGNFPLAMELMLECKDIRARINADVWSSINNLGNIYLSMGDAALALKIHE